MFPISAAILVSMAGTGTNGGNGSNRLRWDGTISAGTIIAMIGIAGPVVIAGVTAINQIRDIQQTVTIQGTDFSNRLDKVETAIIDFKTEFAKRDGQGIQLADHENRLRKLEGYHRP